MVKIALAIPVPSLVLISVDIFSLGALYLDCLISKKEQKQQMKQQEVTIRTNGLSMDIERQEFALALKTWRLRNDLTQKQVGDRWGCSRYTIMRAERGKDITWEMAYRLFAKLSNELIREARDEIHDNH